MSSKFGGRSMSRFFFQAEDGIRDVAVTGVQTCALPISGILENVNRYYTEKLELHGATARGVDWNSVESQRLRFAQLLKICDCREPFTINDYGCGYGALADYLRDTGGLFRYCGFDISSSMIARARELHEAMVQGAFVGQGSCMGRAD